MKEIITNINLIENNKLIKVPTIISLYEIDEDNTNVEITITYNKEKYIGKGSNYLWEDAFANLQSKLPPNIKIVCCMTCIHGNMCPYGNMPRELYCTKHTKIKTKEELCNLFDKMNLYENNKVLCESYCKDYAHQRKDYYTYNDYLSELNKQRTNLNE